jgi:hypothetical protein
MLSAYGCSAERRHFLANGGLILLSSHFRIPRHLGDTSLVLVGPQVRSTPLGARFAVDVRVDVRLQVRDDG